MDSPEAYKSELNPLKLVIGLLKFVLLKNAYFQLFGPKITNVSKNIAPMTGKPK